MSDQQPENPFDRNEEMPERVEPDRHQVDARGGASPADEGHGRAGGADAPAEPRGDDTEYDEERMSGIAPAGTIEGEYQRETAREKAEESERERQERAHPANQGDEGADDRTDDHRSDDDVAQDDSTRDRPDADEPAGDQDSDEQEPEDHDREDLLRSWGVLPEHVQQIRSQLGIFTDTDHARTLNWLAAVLDVLGHSAPTSQGVLDHEALTTALVEAGLERADAETVAYGIAADRPGDRRGAAGCAARPARAPRLRRARGPRVPGHRSGPVRLAAVARPAPRRQGPLRSRRSKARDGAQGAARANAPWTRASIVALILDLRRSPTRVRPS